MNKPFPDMRKEKVMNAQPVTLRKNASLEFSALTLSGDIVYFADQNALALIDPETGFPERLSVNLVDYELTPPAGHVYIKDWSEHTGLTRSLESAGVVDVVRAVNVGPFRSRAYEVRVLRTEVAAAQTLALQTAA